MKMPWKKKTKLNIVMVIIITHMPACRDHNSYCVYRRIVIDQRRVILVDYKMKKKTKTF